MTIYTPCDLAFKINVYDKYNKKIRLSDVYDFHGKFYTTSENIYAECVYNNENRKNIIIEEKQDTAIINETDVSRFKNGVIKYKFEYRIIDDEFEDGYFNNVIDGDTNFLLNIYDNISGGSDIDLSDYYTKEEVYNKEEVDDLISEIDLSDYYTSGETNTLLNNKQGTLTAGNNITITSGNVISSSDVDLSNYYTSIQVNNIIEDVELRINENTFDIETITSDYLTSSSLTNYYTSGETNIVISEYTAHLDAGISSLGSYIHTIIEPKIDENTENIDANSVSIFDLNENLYINYYTSGQTNTAINNAVSGVTVTETDPLFTYWKSGTSITAGAGTQAGSSCVAIGSGATANDNSGVAIGRLARSSNNYATALGNNANAFYNYSTALGNNSRAGNIYATAIGNVATAATTYSTALGSGAIASGSSSISLGHQAQSNNENEIGIGRNNKSISSGTVAEKTQLGISSFLSSSATPKNIIEGRQNDDLYIYKDELNTTGGTEQNQIKVQDYLNKISVLTETEYNNLVNVDPNIFYFISE